MATSVGSCLQWLLVQIRTATALTSAGEEQIKVRNPAFHVGNYKLTNVQQQRSLGQSEGACTSFASLVEDLRGNLKIRVCDLEEESQLHHSPDQLCLVKPSHD